MKDSLNIANLLNPSERYKLGEILGSGVFGRVHRATDSQAGDKPVAVKIQSLNDETEERIHDEYKILRDFTSHPNIIDFYGIFCEKSSETIKIWFILELCECGSVADLVHKMLALGRKMTEEHIAFILKETIKALTYLHENKVMHRNIRCSNLLITKDGEVKLSDFGLSAQLSGNMGKRSTSVGAPSWMAPEVVTSGIESPYDNRADVWALGITTIEMSDGKAPFQDMHPTRALFQIVRNPPPSLSSPAMWSNQINDFIAESLEKNPEYRPFIFELLEHPFIQSVPENDYHLTQELKKLVQDACEAQLKDLERVPERIIKNNLLILETKPAPETMQVEDLAALENLTENSIIDELRTKLEKGSYTSFVGDVLLTINPNKELDIYNDDYHAKYECKSRSDNEPHIYAVADSAYQDALHHKEPQHMVFSGESYSGKTTNMLHAMRHLTYLGKMKNNTAERIEKAVNVIQAASHASTPTHSHSTRAIFQIQITYGTSGKTSGAIFWLYQLEKWRVSSTDMTHANFNLLYYYYDAMEHHNHLEKYSLGKERNYRYLRISDDLPKKIKGARENPADNVTKYSNIINHLKDLEFDEDNIETLQTVLAAILLLGNVRFEESIDGSAKIENTEEAIKVANLLKIEEDKFLWALLNYCLVERGTAIKRRHSSDEARDARDTLAGTLYKRLVDWLINLINFKLSFGRAVFGDKFCVNLLDMFGFECYHRNKLEQLIVNTTNEQIQFLYNQRMFAWEMQEQEEERIPVVSLQFYDNKVAVDQLMGRPLGLFYILDEASRSGHGQEFIRSTIKSTCKEPYIKISGSPEFSVAHFTGKINYDAREMADKNKDFLPPEMIETLRASECPYIQQMFKGKLTKTGNLTAPLNQPKIGTIKTKTEKENENLKARKFNTGSKGQYSQLHSMRTIAATYRATSLELLKQLSIGPGSGGTHFIRCIRPDLANIPNTFQTDVIRQQLKALAILDTAKARQKGYSCRIPFSEFINRYKFLAFDFDENVDITKDNCRLLLIRLKMEGWIIGKTKVFLKYYNEEFLSRLYEVQVKKIVKVQCMMRVFLARRRACKDKAKMLHMKGLQEQRLKTINEEEAALKIQKAYRGYVVRKAYGPLINKSTGKIDEETASFLKKFAMKWKSRSIFQVLLQYRAVKYQDLVNFSQQVHIYNQSLVECLVNTNSSVQIDKIDPQAKIDEYLGNMMPTVWKLPFRIDQLQYFDTTYLCDPKIKNRDTFADQYDSDIENWDEPLKRRTNTAAQIQTSLQAETDQISEDKTNKLQTDGNQSLIHLPFCRDPTQTIKKSTSETQVSETQAPEVQAPETQATETQAPQKQAPETQVPKAQAPETPDSPHARSKSQNTTRSPIPHMRKEELNWNEENSSLKHCVYKRKAPPIHASPVARNNYQTPTPWASQKDLRENSSPSNNVKYTEYSRCIQGGNLKDDMQDPIKELQALAKSTNELNKSGDDPPFNFQAMLKKTPKNRASMKRYGEKDNECFNDNKTLENQINLIKSPVKIKPDEKFRRMDSADKLIAALKKANCLEDSKFIIEPIAIVNETSPVCNERSPSKKTKSPVHIQPSLIKDEISQVNIEILPAEIQTSPVDTKESPMKNHTLSEHIEVSQTSPVDIKESPIKNHTSSEHIEVSHEVSPITIQTSPVRNQVSPLKSQSAPVINQMSPIKNSVPPIIEQPTPIISDISQAFNQIVQLAPGITVEGIVTDL